MPRSSGSMFTVLSVTSCLDLWSLWNRKGKGEREGSAPRSLQPVTRGSLVGQLWSPGFLQWLERRKVTRMLLIAKVSGTWGSEPHRSKEYYIYYIVSYRHRGRPASRDRGLCADWEKKEKKRKRERKRNPLEKIKMPCC